MKKSKLLLLLPLLTLCSCNRQLIDFELDHFDYAHLMSANKCVVISSWNNYEDGDMVQIKFPNGSVILGHSNEIVLIKGICPYCNK